MNQTKSPAEVGCNEGLGGRRMVLVEAYGECGAYADNSPGTRHECAAKLAKDRPCERCPSRAVPAAPQPAERVPLTDEQIAEACGLRTDIAPALVYVAIARAIEAAHGIKPLNAGYAGGTPSGS